MSVYVFVRVCAHVCVGCTSISLSLSLYVCVVVVCVCGEFVCLYVCACVFACMCGVYVCVWMRRRGLCVRLWLSSPWACVIARLGVYEMCVCGSVCLC